MLALQHSNLNAFLFADVGIKANGMALSVLSVLARFDLDPWQEASRLADVSRTKSIEALAALISRSASCWSPVEAVPIAARLVALLPQHAGAAAAAPPDPLRKLRLHKPGPRRGVALTNARWFGILALLAALFAGLASGVVLSPSDAAADNSLPAPVVRPGSPLSPDGFQAVRPPGDLP